MNTLPLPIWPWPLSDDRLALLKAAKASLATDVRVVPVEAVAGLSLRVLAWEPPPFLARYAPIRPENAGSVASIAAALRFVLDEPAGEPDPRWGDVDLLSQWFGAPVVHSHNEDETGKVQFV